MTSQTLANFAELLTTKAVIDTYVERTVNLFIYLAKPGFLNSLKTRSLKVNYDKCSGIQFIWILLCRLLPLSSVALLLIHLACLPSLERPLGWRDSVNTQVNIPRISVSKIVSGLQCCSQLKKNNKKKLCIVTLKQM